MLQDVTNVSEQSAGHPLFKLENSGQEPGCMRTLQRDPRQNPPVRKARVLPMPTSRQAIRLSNAVRRRGQHAPVRNEIHLARR